MEKNATIIVSTFQELLDGYKVYRVHQKFGVIRSLFHLVFLSVNFLIKIILNESNLIFYLFFSYSCTNLFLKKERTTFKFYW